MKGILLTMYEDFVKERHGAAAWYDVLHQATGSDETVFVGPGTYPYDQFLRLVRLVSERAGHAPDGELRAFGRHAFPALARRYPSVIASHDTARSFLLALARVSVEVHKFYHDAELPELKVDDLAPRRLALTYASSLRLCTLAEGFLDGVGAWFQEPLEHEQRDCARRGAPACRFEIRLAAAPPEEIPSHD